MGAKRAVKLNAGDVDAYRNARLGELTRRGTAPMPGTLDREVELLKRMLNYAVTCRRLPSNPIAPCGATRSIKLASRSFESRSNSTADTCLNGQRTGHGSSLLVLSSQNRVAAREPP